MRIGYRISLALIAAMFTWSAGEPPYTFYVQFIRATNNSESGNATRKKVGPKLNGILSPVFRWNFYWETFRRRVAINSGQECRVRVAPGREVRLRMLADNRVDIRYFWQGELRRGMIRDFDAELSVIGSGIEKGDGWFIVVRRDRPTLD